MARRRFAFSRLEQVVAIVIALILAGFLVPAVQKLRAASDRTRCGNNLRSIGVAVRSYHDTSRHVPRGGDQTAPARSAGLSPGARETEWSWAYHILPQLGRNEIHASSDAGAVRSAELAVFTCTARRKPSDRWNGLTMLDYAANAGTLENGTDGLIQRSCEKPFSLENVPDGLGSTLLVAEKRLNVAEFGRLPGDTHGYATPGWTDACEAHRYGVVPPAADLDSPGDRSPMSEFGSSHRGVFLALFADGSVRTLRLSVNPTLWRRVCVSNDHQQFNLNDLQ